MSTVPYELEFERVRSEYLHSAPRRIESLRSILARIPPEPANVRVFDPFREALHRIAGTAGVCGFEDIWERAIQAERAVVSIQRERITPDATILRVLSAAVDEIEAAFRRYESDAAAAAPLPAPPALPAAEHAPTPDAVPVRTTGGR